MLFRPGDGLVQRQLDFISWVNDPPGDFCHCAAKRLEIVSFCLINQDITVSQKQNALLTFCFPQTPDYLESGIGFSGVGRHDQ